MSLAIDLRNAVECPHIDNFTVLLLRLIMKADRSNRSKLEIEYPSEVAAVEIYQSGTHCPYKDKDKDCVDYDKLAKMAELVVKTHSEREIP